MIKCRECDHLYGPDDRCHMKKSHVMNIDRERGCKIFIPKEGGK